MCLGGKPSSLYDIIDLVIVSPDFGRIYLTIGKEI